MNHRKSPHDVSTLRQRKSPVFNESSQSPCMIKDMSCTLRPLRFLSSFTVVTKILNCMSSYPVLYSRASFIVRRSALSYFRKMPPVYGSDYERMCCGCTSLLASQMLSLSPSTNPFTPSSYVLDLSCGPGIATQEIKRVCLEVKILASDISTAMVADVERKRVRFGWKNVETKVMYSTDLGEIGDETFSHVFVNLGMPPEGAPKIVKEIYRVVKTGGVAVISNWAGSFFYTFRCTPGAKLTDLGNRQSMACSIRGRSQDCSPLRAAGRFALGWDARKRELVREVA